jgi:hypothetical protein
VGFEDQGVLELHVLVDLLVEEILVLVLVVEGQNVEVKEGDVPFVSDLLGYLLDDLL